MKIDISDHCILSYLLTDTLWVTPRPLHIVLTDPVLIASQGISWYTTVGGFRSDVPVIRELDGALVRGTEGRTSSSCKKTSALQYHSLESRELTSTSWDSWRPVSVVLTHPPAGSHQSEARLATVLGNGSGCSAAEIHTTIVDTFRAATTRYYM
jgi:hypothetical protein